MSELGRGENLLAFSETMLEPDPEKRKKKAAGRVMGQDLMNGEGKVGPKNGDTYKGQEVRAALRHAPNAQPAGDGGGVWAQFNKDRGERTSIEKGLTMGEIPNYDGAERTITGTSIFDPVLCELAYRWFCPPGGLVLDPFAGGSVRGIVASKLGRHYVGVELSPEQVYANRVQGVKLCADDLQPEWIEGDSTNIVALTSDGGRQLEADFMFSCPPYADLEVYSDDPRDISTMPYGEFRDAYFKIVAEAAKLLRDDAFACFVVGEVRAKDGSYYGFVPDTIEAFRRAGLSFYNEAILVTAAGSLPMRTAKQFAASRKLGKTHQNVLIFVKGNPKAATQLVGEVEFGAIPVDEIEAPEADPLHILDRPAGAESEVDDSEFGEAL